MSKLARFGSFMSSSTVDRPAIAAALMVSSLLMLSFQDSLVKLVNAETSLWQFLALRAVFNIALLTLLARMIWGQERPRPVRPGAVAFRTGLHVTAMLFFFSGFPFLSLPELAAGLYVFPLFVAVLSVVVLKERLGVRRITAIAAGFCGTLLILKPGTDAFRMVGLMPVAAAFCYASAILATRKLCRQESPITLAYALAAGFLIVGTIGMTVLAVVPVPGVAQSWPYLFTGWRDIGIEVVAVFFACSCINVIAMVNLGKAYQSAESSWLAPFDYSYLVFATVWGFVFWHRLPDALTVLGMIMIAAAGSFVAWRERQLRRRAMATASIVAEDEGR